MGLGTGGSGGRTAALLALASGLWGAAGPAHAGDAGEPGLRVFVRRFEVTGSTVFPPDELRALTAEFENRAVSSEEIHRARDRVTRHYIAHGYSTSGVLLPDQRVVDGVIRLEVVEGRLGEVRVHGAARLRGSYLTRRVARGLPTPLRVASLRARLELLQQDPRVRRVRARLGPAGRRGESRLDLWVEEAPPLAVALSFANDRSPTAGAETAELALEHRNLTGFGDALRAAVARSQGIDELDVEYALPLNARGTALSLRYQDGRSRVEEEPFSRIDIESETTSYAVGLTHPLLHTPDRALTLGLTGEYRRSQTFLAGRERSLAAGPDRGESKVAVLRLSQQWTQRSEQQVLAARSTFTLGLDALDATVNPGRIPDGRFHAWLGQFQWVRRMTRPRGSRLLLRADIQLASDPLLSVERFPVGGLRSVRGYRENELVRDNGFAASLELRIPVLRNRRGEDVLHLAPFFDIGGAWNEAHTPSPRTLASLGLGLRYRLGPRLHAELYWGGRLRRVASPHDELQDHGWHFHLAARAF